MLYSQLDATVKALVSEYDQIPESRRLVLQELSDFISRHVEAGLPSDVLFICTHNSRRSHIAQLWAQAAAHYYGIPRVRCQSGGTEATAFNERAVRAMLEAGFDIVRVADGQNPMYEVRFGDDAPPVSAWSKTFHGPAGDSRDFAAVMTCASADAECPFVPGAVLRIAPHYEDPKDFDGTPGEQEAYRQTVAQIGREMLYALSMV